MKFAKWVPLVALALAACTQPIAESSENDAGRAAADRDGGQTNGGALTITDYCASYCNKAQTCSEAFDSEQCTGSCRNDLLSSFDNVRNTYWSNKAACFGRKDCASYFDGTVRKSCHDEAAAVETPSAATKSFCAKLVSARTKCGASAMTGDCLNDFKVFADEALQGAESCFAKGCADQVRCVETSLGF